jgi:hypothetical protein
MAGGNNYDDPRDEQGWVPLSPPNTDDNHVLLTVWRKNQCQVVLNFTVKFVENLAHRPVKWLTYAAWCMHGYDGVIVDNKGDKVGLDERLVSGMHYYFKPSTCHDPRQFLILTTLRKQRDFRDIENVGL